jgi:hypothetical protein
MRRGAGAAVVGTPSPELSQSSTRVTTMRASLPFSVLASAVLALSAVLLADAMAPGQSSSEPKTTCPPPCSLPYGIALAPPIYLINFLLLYFANPTVAARMPGYASAIPAKVYDCLFANPTGCPWTNMKHYLTPQALLGSPSYKWPKECRVPNKYARLSAPPAATLSQINAPMGRAAADKLAAALGLRKKMVLTWKQYRCLVGTPGDKDPNRRIISICLQDLTNSVGSAAVPLSSYGLSLSAKGDVRSNCAPAAPCLEFNSLFAGPLEKIAKECGFAKKLASLVVETPFVEFAKRGSGCQGSWEPVCLANRTRLAAEC